MTHTYSRKYIFSYPAPEVRTDTLQPTYIPKLLAEYIQSSVVDVRCDRCPVWWWMSCFTHSVVDVVQSMLLHYSEMLMKTTRFELKLLRIADVESYPKNAFLKPFFEAFQHYHSCPPSPTADIFRDFFSHICVCNMPRLQFKHCD